MIDNQLNGGLSMVLPVDRHSQITTEITEPEKVIIGFRFRTQVRLRVHRIVIRRFDACKSF